MSEQKRQRREQMGDPMGMAMSMSYMPGAPQGMMNNPMNVTSISPQPGSMDGVNRFPYGDSGLVNDPRMGGGVFPMQPSGMPQNMVRGAGLNAMVPYGFQQQPSPAGADVMEGMRLGENASAKGLMAGNMGPQSYGNMQTLPAAATMAPQQTPATIGLQGMPSLDGQAGMGLGGPQPPGTTPQKKGRNPRGKK